MIKKNTGELAGNEIRKKMKEELEKQIEIQITEEGERGKKKNKQK